MKKSTLLRAALVILPLLVVSVAVGPNAATVINAGTTDMTTWYQIVSESALGWCLPVAGLMNYVLFALAVGYLLLKKHWCARWIRGIAFAALCLAALPIVIQSDVKIIPNVLGLLLLAGDYFVAHVIVKEQMAAAEVAPKGKRLDRR